MNYYAGHPEYRDKKSYDPSESRNVSELIYGCMDLAGTWNKGTLAEMNPSKAKERIDQTIKIIECCLEHGINFFDHANIYGRGKCEEIFAEAIKEMKVARETIHTAEQMRYYPARHSNRIGLLQLFRRLHCSSKWKVACAVYKRTTSMYCFCTVPMPYLFQQRLPKRFTKLQQEGKVLAFGVSNHSSGQITLLQSALPFQLAYNQMEMSFNAP